ncbi:CRISPR-associated endonuclease Cas2 [Thermocrinis minervae]|uniref:CRISPR-associated endoribonuclease Cas2 n=1 Tax=Thermocrinis minervae TaxID=381751 RepID=A0A1M6Q502_9AQUI|nr:CRISPR-associated endonuclease Cas2 [Thermocrinis minervae]SHK15217.1 CRISPR-associated protein, Cas2 family [Thermocrinis minervae]
MRVIMVYDVATDDPEGQKRLNKVRKIAKKYLHHIQKSVFEGNITQSSLERLKYEILQVVDLYKDSVIIYTFEESFHYRREIITNSSDPTDNLI